MTRHNLTDSSHWQQANDVLVFAVCALQFDATALAKQLCNLGDI